MLYDQNVWTWNCGDKLKLVHFLRKLSILVICCCLQMFTLAHAFKAAELLLTLYLIMFLSLVTLLIIIHQQLLSSMYHFLLLVSTPSSTHHLSSQHLQQNISLLSKCDVTSHFDVFVAHHKMI